MKRLALMLLVISVASGLALLPGRASLRASPGTTDQVTSSSPQTGGMPSTTPSPFGTPSGGVAPHPQSVPNANPTKVLLVEDVYPGWGCAGNEAALQELGQSYDVMSAAQAMAADLSHYSIVMVTSDQYSATYDTLAAGRSIIESYVSHGGVLVAHATDQGWNAGQWATSWLPGGVQHVSSVDNYVSILDPTHPVVAGMPGGGPVTDDQLDGWDWSTHGYFTSLLPGTDKVIGITVDPQNQPVYIEYSFGAGRVLATMQPLEWLWPGCSGESKANAVAGRNVLRNELLHAGALATGLCSRRYAAGGDSIPAGADLVSGQGQPYPDHLLQDHLRSLDSQFCRINTAVSGAKSSDYIATQLPSTLAFKPNLITLTVGADNMVLPKLTDECVKKLTGALDFAGARSCAQGLMNDSKSWDAFTKDLTSILTSYKPLMATDPSLIVAVTNYYDPMPTQLAASTRKGLCDQLLPIAAGKCNTMLSPASSAFASVNALIQRLNSKISGVVSTFARSSHGRFVLVNIYDTFKGHCSAINVSFTVSPVGGSASGDIGCPADKSWIVANHTYPASGGIKVLGFTFTLTGQATAGVHPNDAGHKCIGNLIWEAVKSKLGSTEPKKSAPCS